MTIYKGKYDPNSPVDSPLLQVKGTTEYNCKAVEVEKKASSLNSNCVFILKTPSKNFIWVGTVGFHTSPLFKLMPYLIIEKYWR